ncbi:MAG: DUF2188 domain-containing protein [Pseudomonadales bacterium]|nr:DUF2188 domain-containing protein [Pseudomonadales bacterium]
MPKRDTHRVMPHKDGGWQVKRDGTSKASDKTSTKAEAEKIGRGISKNQGTELQIHGKDMKIQRSDSHGNDPYPPKG